MAVSLQQEELLANAVIALPCLYDKTTKAHVGLPEKALSVIIPQFLYQATVLSKLLSSFLYLSYPEPLSGLNITSR